jgi:hypothetical protein
LSLIDRGTDAKVDRARTRAASDSRRTNLIRRLIAGRKRRSVALLALAMLLGVTAVALAGPEGSFVDGAGSQGTGGITKYGPINPETGFPDWYRDAAGNEVEPCYQAADPNCNGPEVPNPDAPTTFPGNFPGEFFYWTGEAGLTANGGNDVLAEFALEGTFAAEIPRFPDQMVFTRTRYRIRGGLQPNAQYKITNPYGVDVVESGPAGSDPDDPTLASLFVTEDIGAAAGAFGQLFSGQVGPLLKWDTPDAPAGYLGDPATPHTVTGSTMTDGNGAKQNYVMIEGPGIGGANNTNPCPGLTAATSPNCIYTPLFSIMGKKSTKGGVDVARTTYSRGAAADAKTQLDVLAESKIDEDIVVRDTRVGNDPATGRRFSTTPLTGKDGRYFAHVDVKSVPDKVEVVNRSDTPMTVKAATVTDHVTGSAEYNTDTDTLHVTAESSDKGAAGGFTAKGFGAVADTAGTPGAGAADFTGVGVPPNSVTIMSAHGGSAEVPVKLAGATATTPLALAAMISAPASVEQRTTVTLDGSASTGDIDGYQWTSADGIAFTSATNGPKATFQAPRLTGAAATAGRDLQFTLKVTSTGGTPPEASQTVTVHVNPVTNATAVIAVNGQAAANNATIDVPQNLQVTLDASGSTGVVAFNWARVSGPAFPDGTVRNTSNLTFLFPKTNRDMVITLTTRQPGVSAAECATVVNGCATATVTLHPVADTLDTTKVRFVADQGRWVIDGTASSTTQNKVHVYSGRTTDPTRLIGSSDVLADTTWSVDARDSGVPVTDCKCVTIVSDRGGEIARDLEKPNLIPDSPIPATPPAAAPAGGATQAAAPTALSTGGAGTAAASVVPLAAQALAVAPATTAPATITAASVSTAGVPVTVAAPAGTSLVRLRVLTTAGKPLFSTFKKVKGGTKVKMKIKSAKLRRKLQPGKRYVIEVRAGTAKNRLGKATRKVFRVRR